MLKHKTISIFHFKPIENYPPIQNLLSFLDSKVVYTCYTTTGKLKIKNKSGSIKRVGQIQVGKAVLFLTYVFYNASSLLHLIMKRPKTVMYYETLSCFPVCVYKKFINKSANVYIHYHEYTSLQEYQNASKINRILHKMERSLYEQTCWISHTNDVRLKMFINDEKLDPDSNNYQVMPNYPSKEWARMNKPREKDEVIKMVYVGYSLTEEGSYLGELVEFLNKNIISSEINIYCIKSNSFVQKLRDSSTVVKINIHDAVDYSELPFILSKHHVGLILYKANTPNYINNAPNKLFEYLNCGLDVWYPIEMEGIYPYDSETKPMVKRLDFGRMDLDEVLEINNNKSRNRREINYIAENIYSKLLDDLNK